MLKTILILVILAAGIFALSYFYKPSRLELTPHMIILKVGAKDANYPYSVIKKESKTFGNLKLKQYTIEYENEKLIFEEAMVDGLYEFNANPRSLISKLFDIENIHSIFVKNGLEALRLTLKSGERINLFMLQQDSNELRLLYGMSDKSFSEKVEKLVGKTLESFNASPIDQAVTLWSNKVNDMDGVLNSIDH